MRTLSSLTSGSPASRIFVGPWKASPERRHFTLRLRDRHGIAWADYNRDAAVDAFIVRGGLKGKLGGRRAGLVGDELMLARATGFVDRTKRSGIVKRTCRGREGDPIDVNGNSVVGQQILYLEDMTQQVAPASEQSLSAIRERGRNSFEESIRPRLPRIDEPGKIPDIYAGAGPRVTEFETELWKNFWRLADDPDYRKEKGVSVADGDGTWRPIAPGSIYSLTLQATGDVTISSEPIKGIYKEMLKRQDRTPGPT